MDQFDRRDWLKVLGLGLSAAVVPQFRLAQSVEVTMPPDPGRTPLRLSLNENPFGPAPSVVAQLQREFSHLCRYSDTQVAGLLKSIAAKESISDDKIILGEILEPLGTHLSLTGGAGGEFIFSDPGYTALIDSAAAIGGKAIPVPLNAVMQNDLPAIAAKINRRTRAVFLVNPHNPTGTVTDADEFKHFVLEVSRRTLVIVDEAYLEFADVVSQRTVAGLVEDGANVIVFRTFAKIYGLAGLDIGYGLVPKRIGFALQQQGLNNPHLFNRLAVAAAAASLADAHYVASVAAAVAHERQIWLQSLRDWKVKFTPSNGNFVFFETGMPHAEFAALLLKDAVDIGRAFPPYDKWARISIGLPEENTIARMAVEKLLAKRH